MCPRMHTHSHRIQIHASMYTLAKIYHRYNLSMAHIHPQPHRSIHCLRVKTRYAIDWVMYVLLSGIYCQGFGLGSMYQVSVGLTCAGSQMTLWSNEDLIREKLHSLTQVFFLLSASDACWRAQFNDERRLAKLYELELKLLMD